MAKKGRATKPNAASQASTSSANPQPRASSLPFHSPDAENRFHKYTTKRGMLMEKGFTWSEDNASDFPDDVSRVIRFHHWQAFCQNPPPASVLLVKEFYANYDSTRPHSVYVRGKWVVVTASAINSLFNLADHQDTYFESAPLLAPSTLDTILTALTAPSTEWSRTSTGAMTFPRASLKPGPKIWIHFLKHNLLPSTHDTLIHKERAILLYCLMARHKINVGKLIARQIEICAGRTTGGLWFPSIITRLCARHNVMRAADEPILQPPSPLSPLLIARILREEPSQRASDPQPSQTDSVPPAARSSSHPLASVLQGILHYLHHRDAALLSFCQATFGCAPKFPPFPTHLYQSHGVHEDTTPDSTAFPAPSPPHQSHGVHEDTTPVSPAFPATTPIPQSTAAPDDTPSATPSSPASPDAIFLKALVIYQPPTAASAPPMPTESPSPDSSDSDLPTPRDASGRPLPPPKCKGKRTVSTSGRRASERVKRLRAFH